MSDSPQYFFETFLQPNYRDWISKPLDIRLAMNTALSANQLADWQFNYFKTKNGASEINNLIYSEVARYRDFLAETECPDFKIIRDVADCHKHVTLNGPSKVVSSAQQTDEGLMGWGEGGYGEGVWGGGPQLVVTLDTGQKRAFSAPMSNVFEMWKRLLT